MQPRYTSDKWVRAGQKRAAGSLVCRYFACMCITAGSFLHPLAADTVIWTGNGANGGWDKAENWGGELPIFDNTLDVVFYNAGITHPVASYLKDSRKIRSLLFNKEVNETVTIRLTSTEQGSTARGLRFESNAPDVVSTSITVEHGAAGDIEIGLAGGNINLSSTLEITHNGEGVLTLSRPIGDAGGITKTGGGILVLSGTNTYTGTTVIQEGSLHVTGKLGRTDITVGSNAFLGFAGGRVLELDGTLHFEEGAGIRILKTSPLSDYSLSVQNGIELIFEVLGKDPVVLIAAAEIRGIPDLVQWELSPPVLASVFSDHMVLQRDCPVPIWGTAVSGEEVNVTFAGQIHSAVADSKGAWRVTLDPLEADSSPQDLMVAASGYEVVLNNVVVGEVWLCSGQSNMEWRILNLEDPDPVIAGATNDLIRLYHVPKRISLSPQENMDAQWQICSTNSIPEFSSLAYFFGRRLQADLQVPVGLVLSAWGGTRIEGWVPEQGYGANPELLQMYNDTEFPDTLNPSLKEHRQYPTVLYNGMIHGLIPFAIRGVIWYQGEANVPDDAPALYIALTQALLDNGWRDFWGYQFPFYFVQLAPYKYWETVPTNALPRMWEAQTEITRQIENTGMVVVSDYASLNNVHPPNKEVPGTRLALLAEAKTYGMDTDFSGPVFRSVRKDGSELVLEFDFSEGLSTRDQESPDWFEIAGKNGVYSPASAVIDGETVRVSSAEVPDPSSVRYSWSQSAINNLVNRAGLPASSFRAIGADTLTDPTASVSGAVAEIQWNVEPDGIAGYYLERLTSEGWARLNGPLLLPDASNSVAFIDPSAMTRTSQSYRVVTMLDMDEAEGVLSRCTYGPYKLNIYAAWASQFDWNTASSEAAVDADGDGMDNLGEFFSGTDPLDPFSVFKVDQFISGDDGAEVFWKTVPGRRYQIQQAASLTNSFTVIGTVDASTEDLTSYLIPIDSRPFCFFRVVLVTE